MNHVQLSGARHPDNFNARGIRQSHGTCQVRRRIPSEIAAERDDDRFKLFTHNVLRVFILKIRFQRLKTVMSINLYMVFGSSLSQGGGPKIRRFACYGPAPREIGIPEGYNTPSSRDSTLLNICSSSYQFNSMALAGHSAAHTPHPRQRATSISLTPSSLILGTP